MIKKAFIGVYYFVLCFATLELSVYLFLKTPFGQDRLRGNLPGYSFENIKNKFWGKHNEHFGIWHESNSSYRHKKSCFDVVYHSNSHGAVDSERSFKSDKKRTVVLGDSFMAGYGLSREKRLTNLLEKESGVELLNFAISGYFGTAQYYLLYKNLAKKFDHDEVVIGILPYNDFQDNDFQAGKIMHAYEYRPYFVGDFPDYELVYFRDNLDAAQHRDSRHRVSLMKILLEFSFVSNAVRQIVEEIRYRTANFDDPKNPYALMKLTGSPFSGYYEFREKDFELMKFTLEKIREEAAGKEVTIILIPTLQDMLMYRRFGEAPLSKKFKQFGRSTGIKIFDLLPHMHDYTRNWQRYYFPCDYHWNEFGNQVAFDFLKNRVL